MKISVLFSALILLASPLRAADSPKDEVKSAAKKLAEKNGYSWKTTVEAANNGGGNRFRPGPTEGKTEKDGVTSLSMTFGDNTAEAYLKGDKGAIKTADGWKSLAEASEGEPGQQNPGRFIAMRLKSFKSPAAEAEDLAGKTKDLQKSGEAWTGELNEEGLKQLMARGPRPNGGEVALPNDAKGTVKFWVKDGVLSKFEHHVQGTRNNNGNEVKIDRTTTVEIKEVGSTKVTVPDEAKKKLS